MLYCDGCEWLSPTEEEQNKNPGKDKHMCLKLRKQVYHMFHHPNIISDEKCPKRKNVILH